MKPMKDLFLPYQQRWIKDPATIAIGQKSRRIGWTYASSYRAVSRRLRLGTNLYHTSADLSAAREFTDYCQHWARTFKELAAEVKQEVIDEADGITAFVLRFKNGSRIVAGSSNPKFFRSKGGDADADEFAFHPNARELYKAMQPTAIVWGHQLRVWSSHCGEGSFFAKLVGGAKDFGSGILDCGSEEGSTSALVPSSTNPQSEIRIQPSSTPSLHTVTLLQAVEAGLVEKIRNLGSPDPIARQEFIEEIRASCPDEDAWNEEYLCRPSSEQSSLLSYSLIGACESEWRGRRVGWDDGGIGGWEDADDDRALSSSAHSLYAGFDVGRKHDRSVLWLLERVGDVFCTRAVRVFQDVSFTAQEQMLIAVMSNRAVKRLCIDSTGIGAMLAERLAVRFRHRVEPVHFTAPVKSELALPLLRLFQDRLIRIPADATIREDLHKVRKIVTAANNVRLDADRDKDGHADRFWALALAHHAADLERGNELSVRSAMRKPVGWS